MSTIKVNKIENTATADGGINIDSSGRVLMGTTTEGEATADNLTIADSSHCGITLRSGTSSVGTVFFSDGTSGTDEYRGYVQYDHGGNFLKFATDATERIRIDSSGTLKLVSSTGIDFSGIQTNASGMTSETLDSYEEGTWTPTTAGDSTGAISSASGFYTKVGNLVVCSFSFTLTTNFTNGDVGGLPFTPKDIGPNFNGAFLQTTADRAFVVQNHNSRLATLKISNGTYPAVTNSTRCTITYLTA